MATRESIAIRRSDALDRLRRGVRRAANRLGVDAVEIPERGKDAGLLAVTQFEALADAVEGIDGALKERLGFVEPIELEVQVGQIALPDDVVLAAYGYYDSDPRVHGPDDLDAFADAVRKAWAEYGGTELEPGEITDPEAYAAALAAGTISEISPAASDLQRKNRAELEALAAERGIENPASFPNKDALVAAIEAAGAAKGAQSGEDGESAPTDQPATDIAEGSTA